MVTQPPADPFVEAALKLFPNAQPGDTISTDIEGPRDVQIGDYTWDTDPAEIEVMLIRGGGRIIETLTYSSLSEVWAAIAEVNR